MLVAWRVCKTRHHPFDGTGARLQGARWNSPGRAVVYASDTFAGALLEILAHALRPRTLPGAHHAVRLEIPDDLVETMPLELLAGWDQPGAERARARGDAWLASARSVALVVPALPSRPVGRTVMVNPEHPAIARVMVGAPFAVPWDERLF